MTDSSLAHENYNFVSEDYAKVREPVGLDILLGCYFSEFKDLSTKKLADIGCGAGVYSYPLAKYFGEVCGIDRSSGQIQQAQNKEGIFQDVISNPKFSVGNATSLDIEDMEFDAVLMSLMLHHVREDGVSNTMLQKKAIEEACRILKPSGTLIFGLCSKSQVYDGAWYCSLVPSRIPDERIKLHPEIANVIEMCETMGFTFKGRYVQTDRVLQGKQYFNRLGPLDESWRNADSLFSSLTETELNSFVKRIEEMEKMGSLKAFIERHNELRANIGQVTFLKLVKPAQTVDS